MTDRRAAEGPGHATERPAGADGTAAQAAGVAPDATDRVAALGPDGPDEMGREIAEGPRAVEATLGSLRDAAAEIDAAIAGAGRLVLVGTGASLAVIECAAPFWRASLRTARRGPLVASPALVIRQSAEAVLGESDGETFLPGDAVVAVSQSGGSPETASAARAARVAGARVIAVTARPDSALATAADVVVHTPIGAPEGGASTKSALAACAALLAMAGALPPGAGERAVRELEAAVADQAPAAAAARVLAEARRTWALGFGPAAGLARAAYLIWHEKVIRPLVALTPSEFRHGAIEAAAPGDAVMVVDPGPFEARRAAYLDRLRSELDAMGVGRVEVAVETDPAPPSDPADPRPALVPLPRSGTDAADPAVAALVALLRIQELARWTAHAGGTYRDGFAVLRHVVHAADDLFA